MKKYVFLTEHLSGLTGSERYVNNKCKLLKEHGWEVLVLWNYNIGPVQLEYLKPFDNLKYIHHELKFWPSWFSERERNKVVNRLVSTIGCADQIVVESSKLEIGAWGELVAKRICCKHLIFVVTEDIRIHNRETFEFCYAKMKRDEFFTINEPAVKFLFSKFTSVEHPERYYWDAVQGVEVSEYPFPAFDLLPKANYTITSFGREKGYFPYMLDELKFFISQHPGESFNLFFLGGVCNENKIRDSLSLDNVNLAIYPQEVMVVPRQIFEKSDVVIATAGCALLSASNGCKTISMDVNKNVPLGLLYYTTLDSNTDSGQFENSKSLRQWLDSLLVNKVVIEKITNTYVLHDYKYQMKFISHVDCNYIDSSKLMEPMTRHDSFFSYIVKVGLFRVVEYLYYSRRGVKIIKR